jgi:hypothetical protein
LKFLQQQSQTVQKITPSGLKTKKDQSLSIITKNKKFTEDIEQMKQILNLKHEKFGIESEKYLR